MCGIAGYLSYEGPSPRRAVVKRMCDRILHRGPDSEGYFVDNHAAIGMRRLRIIDLSTGDQPMGNEDGRLQIVFNGEIYNYLELRKDLVRKGHVFKTHSDTEVIVHLYEEAGEQTPEYLNGMFAFAIWDSGRQELFAAHDRFGKKPFYYSTAVPGMSFCFASELKALRSLEGVPDTVNATAVADFLALGYVPPPATIFKDIHRLRPGESITVRRNSHVLRRYWQPRFQQHADISVDRKIEELQALAADAVQRRMTSDVPLGAFLSGGVDSSGVVALMASAAGERVKTFSIGFTSKTFDELEYARLIATRYKTDHHELVVSPSIADVLAPYVDHYDEPFADSSAIPMLYLSKLTREHVTVALSGDGADEIFGGYRRYRFGILEEQLRRRFPSWFRRSVLRVGAQYYPKFDYLPRIFRAKATLRNLSVEFGAAYYASVAVVPAAGDLQALLSPDIRSELGGYTPLGSFTDRFQSLHELSPLQQMQAVDYETYLPGDILVKADLATMAYSLESRSPWLDYRLGEFAWSLPGTLHVKGSVGKYIFKKALKRYLPDSILTRSKMGFVVPLAEWFRTSLKPLFEESVLLNPDMEQYVNPGEVRRLWRGHQSGLHDHSRRLWSLLMLACWERRHHLGRAVDVTSLVAASQ
jgi:asparagine synthase (glutamine-hydrolysing)